MVRNVRGTATTAQQPQLAIIYGKHIECSVRPGGFDWRMLFEDLPEQVHENEDNEQQRMQNFGGLQAVILRYESQRPSCVSKPRFHRV